MVDAGRIVGTLFKESIPVYILRDRVGVLYFRVLTKLTGHTCLSFLEVIRLVLCYFSTHDCIVSFKYFDGLMQFRM